MARRKVGPFATTRAPWLELTNWFDDPDVRAKVPYAARFQAAGQWLGWQPFHFAIDDLAAVVARSRTTVTVPLSARQYRIDASSIDAFTLTFTDDINRSTFARPAIDISFAAVPFPPTLRKWVAIGFTQPATGGVQVTWSGGVWVDPSISISQVGNATTTVYAFTTTGGDWGVYPAGIASII